MASRNKPTPKSYRAIGGKGKISTKAEINSRIKDHAVAVKSHLQCRDRSGSSGSISLDSEDADGSPLSPLSSPNMPRLFSMEARRGDSSPRTGERVNLLITAAEAGDAEYLRQLVQCGQAGRINFQNKLGWTALHASVRQGYVDCVKVCLSCPTIKLEARVAGKTALHLAAQEGRTEIAKLLVEAGAPVGAQDNIGDTSLHVASLWGKLDIVQLLVDSGAEVDALNFQNNTPLHLATVEAHADVVEVLLAAGASAIVRNWLGDSPLSLSNEANSNRIREMFLDGQQRMSDLDLLSHMKQLVLEREVMISPGSDEGDAAK